MRRYFPLLLLLYVAMDFANPLMPGAVSFDAGSIEVVQADRTPRPARTAVTPARLAAALPTWSVVETNALHPRPTAPVAPLASVRTIRRAPPERYSPPPSSSEDH